MEDFPFSDAVLEPPSKLLCLTPFLIDALLSLTFGCPSILPLLPLLVDCVCEDMTLTEAALPLRLSSCVIPLDGAAKLADVIFAFSWERLLTGTLLPLSSPPSELKLARRGEFLPLVVFRSNWVGE